jgi:hypothetical protein
MLGQNVLGFSRALAVGDPSGEQRTVSQRTIISLATRFYAECAAAGEPGKFHSLSGAGRAQARREDTFRGLYTTKNCAFGDLFDTRQKPNVQGACKRLENARFLPRGQACRFRWGCFALCKTLQNNCAMGCTRFRFCGSDVFYYFFSAIDEGRSGKSCLLD